MQSMLDARAAGTHLPTLESLQPLVRSGLSVSSVPATRGPPFLPPR